jgi:hypothetical protein
MRARSEVSGQVSPTPIPTSKSKKDIWSTSSARKEYDKAMKELKSMVQITEMVVCKATI